MILHPTEIPSTTSFSYSDVIVFRKLGGPFIKVFGLEITTFEQVEKKILRYPKKKKGEINRIEDAVKAQLGSDKTLNIAALANLLKDLLKK